MFRHSLFYQLKIMLRNRQGLLWGMLFPLAYGLIYMFSFQGMTQETTEFEPIPVAIVFDGDQAQEDSIKELLGNIGEFTTVKNEEVVIPENYINGERASENFPLLFVEAETEDAASQYLNDGIIDQAISPQVDDQGQLNFSFDVTPAAANSINASIVYAILSYFASNTNAFTLLYDGVASLPDPTEAMAEMELKLSNLDLQQDHIVASSRTPGVSPWSNYYYVCLAYVCIYFMALGINLIIENEAKYGVYALRETVSPSKKFTRFFATFFLWEIAALLVVYLLLIIFNLNGVPLGQESGRIIALMTLGTTTGLLLGTALAATFKVSEGLLNVITTIVPLVLAAMSGMMSYELKLWVIDHVPVLNKLNPVALINDAFYYLNNYPTYQQFNQNMSMLVVLALACFIITLVGIRRTDYESL
ncbi:ABC transporter permease [Aerococcus agrisoli]|uniref:ABC transporter permease n=1 Tax=Aerococcus agrisoli TaxID=2487350 RepID=A0A3N4GH60_9LACT|nr:ABC transporter permease [Aerococcus agrisoli]RPA58451.1 ABC transporter permease [Aerococcus agrisoli]